MRKLTESDIFSRELDKRNNISGKINAIISGAESSTVILNEKLYSEIKRKIVDKKRDELSLKMLNAISSGGLILFTLPPEKRLSTQIPFIICKINGVRTVAVNMCDLVVQTKYNDGSIGFFIRPEAIDLYSKYIDVFELRCSKDVCNTIYEIFAIDKEWYGDLKEFLIDWNSNLDNRFIIPQFAEARLNCKKRCLKGHPCHVCERIIDISKKLKEGKVVVRYNKDYKAPDDNSMTNNDTI